MTNKIDNLSYKIDLISCGGFQCHYPEIKPDIPQCYQCVNRDCSVGAQNYMTFAEIKFISEEEEKL